VFVSDDVRARRTSGKKPPSLTAAECVGLMVAEEIVTREQAEGALVVWGDARNQHGRPKDWESSRCRCLGSWRRRRGCWTSFAELADDPAR